MSCTKMKTSVYLQYSYTLYLSQFRQPHRHTKHFLTYLQINVISILCQFTHLYKFAHFWPKNTKTLKYMQKKLHMSQHFAQSWIARIAEYSISALHTGWRNAQPNTPDCQVGKIKFGKTKCRKPRCEQRSHYIAATQNSEQVDRIGNLFTM
jgi:hypothetical protein